jgi:predicted RND superfamily exporter protein
LDVEVDILALLPGEAREVQGLKLLRTHFESQNDLLLLIEASDGEGADAAVKSLQANTTFGALVKEARVLNSATDVNQAGALLSWVLQNASAASLQRLRDRLEPVL